MSGKPRGQRAGIFRFTRRYLAPRLSVTLLHRNVLVAMLLAGFVVFVSFRYGWPPALKNAAVKDLVAGLLAFSALGFGAATAATVLALAVPRGQLYYTMIANGEGAPRARINKDNRAEPVDPQHAPLLTSEQYGPAFRSFYGDLIFTFLWTLGTQLALGVASILYFAIAGDLNLVDRSECRRSSIGLFLITAVTTYAILQLGSLMRAMADYARNLELYDRQDIGL